MGKVAATILGALVGGLAAAIGTLLLLGWGHPMSNEASQIALGRGDYIDFMLTVVTVLLGAVGLAVTLGAVVIGIVALKTLGEIKDEALNAAGQKMDESMANDLAPCVVKSLEAVLPAMAKDGELDAVFERVVVRIQNGDDFKEQRDPGELD